MRDEFLDPSIGPVGESDAAGDLAGELDIEAGLRPRALDEFIELFERNHWPILREQLAAGRFLNVSAATSRFHGDGGRAGSVGSAAPSTSGPGWLTQGLPVPEPLSRFPLTGS